jgi:hypothetical protein
MTRESLYQLLRLHFPHSPAFAITGSQAKRTHFLAASDIDVIVFDTYNSTIITEQLVSGSFKVDCTIIPLVDITNVIRHDYADVHSILFTMINNCETGYDPGGILAELKTIVQEVSKQVSPYTLKRKEELNKRLDGFRKYFARDLDMEERTVLLADFLSMLTQMAVIDEMGWEADRLLKTRLLKQRRPEFLKEVVALYQQAMSVSDLRFLNAYITAFQHSLQKNAPGSEEGNICFSFSSNDFSWKKVCDEILPAILKSDLLQSTYLYTCLSPKKYPRLYKYQASITFKREDGMPDSTYLNAIVNIGKIGEGFVFEPVYLLPEFSDSYATARIGAFRQILSKYACAQAQTGEMPDSIAAGLLLLVMQELLLSIEDSMIMNNYLLQRSLLTSKEQKSAGSKAAIDLLAKQKIQNLEQVYKRQQNIYHALVKKPNEKTSIDTLFREIIEGLKGLLSDQTINFRLHIFPYSLFSYLQVENILSCEKYMIVAEDILQFLNYPDEAKARVLYCIMQTQTNGWFS